MPQANRNDDTGLVARAFNQTVDGLRWSTTALQAMNADLEKRSELQTLELHHRNSELVAIEAKFRSIYEGVNEGIFRTTPSGGCLSANPAMFKMLGYESEAQIIRELTNLSQQLYVEADRRTAFQQLLALDGRADQFEAEVFCRDGQRIWISISCRAVPGSGAAVLFYEGTVRDVTHQRQIAAELLKSEAEARKLAMVVSRTQNPVLITGVDGIIEWVNPAAEQLTGYTLAELRGKSTVQMLHGPETDPQTVARIFEHVAAGESFKAELLHYSQVGRKHWVSMDGQALRDETGTTRQYIIMQQDVTDRKLSDWLEQDRRKILERIARNEPLRATLNAICQAVHRQREQVTASILMYDATGRDNCRAPAPPLHEAVAPFVGQLKFTADLTHQPVAAQQEACESISIVAGNGVLLGELIIYSDFCQDLSDGQMHAVQSLAGLAGIAIEHQQLTEKLAYEAVHDPLTKLGNRRMLDSQLPVWISSAQQSGRSLALLMIDLDGFKQINDTLGHPVGDALLQQVAVRLKQAARDSDVLVRTGGDEFTLVATEVQSAGNIDLIANRLLAALAAPCRVEDHELFVTASVGVAVFSQDGLTAADLQRKADTAMYAAKAAGRNRYIRFDERLSASALDRLELQNHLRRAVDDAQLHLVYQPQVDHAGRVVGVEALLRWNLPGRGSIPPSTFIPLAERCGLIVPIGTWVLHQACRQARAWDANGCPPVSIAVNVSALQFDQPDFLETVRDACDRAGLAPERLELELTESMLVGDTAVVVEKLNAVKSLGVATAIDDFGTGYSSLSCLQQLPMDRLKIDQSFVRGLRQETMNRSEHTAVLSAIISLAGGLNKHVVAEGVETVAQRNYLVALGCQTLQGYLFSRPVPAEEMAHILTAGTITPAEATPRESYAVTAPRLAA